MRTIFLGPAESIDNLFPVFCHGASEIQKENLWAFLEMFGEDLSAATKRELTTMANSFPNGANAEQFRDFVICLRSDDFFTIIADATKPENREDGFFGRINPFSSPGSPPGTPSGQPDAHPELMMMSTETASMDVANTSTGVTGPPWEIHRDEQLGAGVLRLVQQGCEEDIPPEEALVKLYSALSQPPAMMLPPYRARMTAILRRHTRSLDLSADCFNAVISLLSSGPWCFAFPNTFRTELSQLVLQPMNPAVTSTLTLTLTLTPGGVSPAA